MLQCRSSAAAMRRAWWGRANHALALLCEGRTVVAHVQDVVAGHAQRRLHLPAASATRLSPSAYQALQRQALVTSALQAALPFSAWPSRSV